MRLSQFLGGLLILSLLGCQDFNIRSQSPDTNDNATDEFETRLETTLIGDRTTFAGLNLMSIEGVGLVVGLDGTGGDPPPSPYRTALLEDMKRRNIPNPNSILRSPSTALVLIRGHLEPMVRKKDRFDVEVRLAGGSEATSLAGGWLLPTFLTEQAIVPGRGILKGHEAGIARGPILISPADDSQGMGSAALKRGKILGGGISMMERDLSIYLRNDFRSYRNSQRIADRIGMRFHHFNKYGSKEPMAVAKTDQRVELIVHPRYKDNFPRYLQVIRHMAFRESPVAQRVRMETLAQQLNNPPTADRAALQLEAIGPTAIPILKTGLKNPSLEVRFHSAVALAYLDQSDGVEALAEAAREEPAFRVFALAAMATIDTADSHLLLRDLMNERSSELRYGAFRALWTLDKRDPFIRGEKLYDSSTPDDEHRDFFMLHVLRTESSPMVHVTQRRHAEIVLFGADQRLRTPLAVRAGKRILLTAPAGSETITISRFEVGEEDQRRQVSTRIADVIRAVAEFGGTYPDVVHMLVQAEKQDNLPGRIEVDALPQSGRVYHRPETDLAQGGSRRARVGRSNLVPNIFPSMQLDSRQKLRDTLDDSQDDFDDDDGSGSASLVDLSESPQQEEEKKPKIRLLNFFKRD